jgi:hypothetical protein
MRLSLHGQHPTSDTLLLNEADPCLAYANAERPRMAKRGETETRQCVPFGLGPIHPSHDFHAVPPRIAKRDELVWLYRK